MTSTTFFIIFIPILAILLLSINLLLAPHNPYQEKDSVFECGFHSFLGQNRTQFSISFFIFGLLFLLFDLEILLVYPYSVSSYTNDIYGLVIMMVFFVLLTLGFIFELGKNALTIDSRQTFFSNGDLSTAHGFISSFFTYPIFAVDKQLLLIINNTKMSGFYEGKGKGKLVVPNEEESEKRKSSSDLEDEDQDDTELRRAIALSLQKDKKGQSSKNEDNYTDIDDFQVVSGYTQWWKILKDRFDTIAIKHNLLREKVNKQTTIDKQDTELLSQYLKETKELRGQISIIEDKLLKFGVDPQEQFGSGSPSDSDSNSSGYSTDTSEPRPTKRVKHLDPKNNTDMVLVFPIFNFVVPFNFIIRFLSIILSWVFLLLVYLNILPNLMVPLIDISFIDLLSLYLIANLIKLVYKMYTTILILYNSYRNKDYVIIYANLFFSIIIILWYFIG